MTFFTQTPTKLLNKAVSLSTAINSGVIPCKQFPASNVPENNRNEF